MGGDRPRPAPPLRRADGAEYPVRIAVLVIALAAHSILAKTIYANPPAGVSVDEAHMGAMLIYYGGDVVDVAILTILCAHWYRDAGRSIRREMRSAKRLATSP